MKNVAFAGILLFGGCWVKDDISACLRRFTRRHCATEKSNTCAKPIEARRGMTASLFVSALILIVALESCSGGNENAAKITQPCKGLRLAGFSLEYEVDRMDTTLASGKYLDFSLREDSTIMIAWGSKEIGHIDAIESEKYPGWAAHFYWCEFENYIGLRYSCGSPCWSLTLLPLRENDSIVTLMEDLAVDTKRGYIFGNRCAEEGENDFCLYNVNSRKHQSIILPGLEWTGDIMTVLDSCAFVEEGLFVRWVCHGSDSGWRDTLISVR